MEKGRFAPSPSGRMHLGNVLCCLLAWLSAKSKGGRIVLRVEDLDTARCPRRYAEQLMDDLIWLGLPWDEGPDLPAHGDGAGHGDSAGRGDGAGGQYFQSQRTALYRAALDRLEERGLVYPCFCTRAELHAASAPHREDGQTVYAGTCRNLTPSETAERSRTRKSAVRIIVPDRDISFTDQHWGAYRENLARECGDFLLRRSDGLFAYQLAVVVDDAAMGVTEVVRGADLLSSTPRQLYLYDCLGLTPPRFCHIPLLLSADGRRLSKRDQSLGLAELREAVPPDVILGRLAYLAGFHPSARPASAVELLGEFDWERVPRSDIRLPEGLF